MGVWVATHWMWGVQRVVRETPSPAFGVPTITSSLFPVMASLTNPFHSCHHSNILASSAPSYVERSLGLPLFPLPSGCASTVSIHGRVKICKSRWEQFFENQVCQQSAGLTFLSQKIEVNYQNDQSYNIFWFSRLQLFGNYSNLLQF